MGFNSGRCASRSRTIHQSIRRSVGDTSTLVWRNKGTGYYASIPKSITAHASSTFLGKRYRLSGIVSIPVRQLLIDDDLLAGDGYISPGFEVLQDASNHLPGCTDVVGQLLLGRTLENSELAVDFFRHAQ